jgi:ABC-type multidrug transport system ATPase subunit
MSSIAIEFSQVSKHFGATTALRDVCITIRKGSCHALAGINGSGKTTLLNCLLDFLRADHGQIRIQGTTSTRPEARRNLRFLPERFSAPPFLKGGEFIDFLLALGGERATEDKTREVCATLDLDYALLEYPVRQLSKGMAQKLGLAASFLSSKPLLILDEPMSAINVAIPSCLAHMPLVISNNSVMA